MKRLTKSRTDRKFLGVIGGLASYLEVDSALLRVIFLILSFITFSSVIWLYLIMAIIIPFEE